VDLELLSTVDEYCYIHRELLQTQQCCLVLGMRGCTGCWDDLWLGPVDFWIQSLCWRVDRLHKRERVDTRDSVLFEYSQRTQHA
jgi:hypothetical protein